MIENDNVYSKERIQRHYIQKITYKTSKREQKKKKPTLFLSKPLQATLGGYLRATDYTRLTVRIKQTNH